MASQPRRTTSASSLPWKPQITLLYITYIACTLTFYAYRIFCHLWTHEYTIVLVRTLLTLLYVFSLGDLIMGTHTSSIQVASCLQYIFHVHTKHTDEQSCRNIKFSSSGHTFFWTNFRCSWFSSLLYFPLCFIISYSGPHKLCGDTVGTSEGCDMKYTCFLILRESILS
jgi:hypothetical protein